MRATGIGSMPVGDGTYAEATAIVVGELADFPHLVELPGKGPGADMLGRGGALLSQISSDLSWETTPAGWRQTSGQGMAMRRALSMLGESMDALEERLDGYTGDVKAQVVGPWTFAASVDTAKGARILRDLGFVDDIVAALTQAAVNHIKELRKRLPLAKLWIQIDEPSVRAVLDGKIVNASGMGTIAAVDIVRMTSSLRGMVDAIREQGARVAIHCCSSNPPWPILLKSGVDAVSFDVALHQPQDDDYVGELFDQGRLPWLGVVPTRPVPSAADAAKAMGETLRRRIGIDEQSWGEHIVVTPACGFGNSDPAWTRTALAATRGIIWQS